MVDIEKVLAEELPPTAITPQPAAHNASEAITADRPRKPMPAGLTPFPPGVSGNPLGAAVQSGRYTLTRALKDELTVGEAKRIARTAIEAAAGGNPRWAEYIRDTTEGKPGVRIADGEWNPETAPTFNIMAKYAAVVGQPQTGTGAEPESLASSDQANEATELGEG